MSYVEHKKQVARKQKEFFKAALKKETLKLRGDVHAGVSTEEHVHTEACNHDAPTVESTDVEPTNVEPTNVEELKAKLAEARVRLKDMMRKLRNKQRAARRKLSMTAEEKTIRNRIKHKHSKRRATRAARFGVQSADAVANET